MNRVPIKSSNLKTVGYDPVKRTLEVEFHSGAVHHFHDVPPEHHVGLLGALSPGSYFHAHIKGRFNSRPG